MITFSLCAMEREWWDKEIIGGLRDGERKREQEGRTGRFCARRGIHTVRFGSTDYAHSSLTEGTSINVAQEHGAICLGRETSRCSIAGLRLTADACTRKDLSWPHNPRTPFSSSHSLAVSFLWYPSILSSKEILRSSAWNSPHNLSTVIQAWIDSNFD